MNHIWTTAQLNMTNGVDKYRENVRLNPHLFRKMEQAQRNMMISGRRNRIGPGNFASTQTC